MFRALTALRRSLLGETSARHVRREIRDENVRLDAAISNMCQGLCMFDAQNRLVVWNERYREMYAIEPSRVWAGCTVRDLLNARIAAGTFPLDPSRYDDDLHAALQAGKAFTLTVALADGRVIAVVNQPMAGGGWVATHEDITDRTRAEQELARTRSFLDTIIDNVPTPIVVKSLPDLRYLLLNKAAEKFFGMPAAEVIGKTTFDIVDRQEAEAIHARDLEMLKSGREEYTGEHSFVARNGETRVVTSSRLPIMGPDGKPQYLIGVVHDITQRKRDEAQISYMAYHDPQTDLPNRKAFNECLNAMFESAATADESFAVLCVDIDQFKSVNDVFGHAGGDALLRQIANRLEAACQGAFLARIGGDEFIAISPTGPQPATAMALGDRLIGAMAAEFDLEGQRVNVGLTIGVGIFPSDGENGSALIANADAALHRAKAEARGSLRFFEPEMDRALREKRALQHDLRAAIARDEIELHYQPQATIDGEITGFEALARWTHPQRGKVPPDVFIPAAEESGLIVSLGETLLRKACKEAASWPRPLIISVNLSPVQFRHGDLPNLVHGILLDSGLAAGRLELEVTEGVLIGDFSRALSILRRLKNLGVKIAMDDFGTGYSSLSYLHAFPFDKIKIDRAFVANLDRNPQSAAIIRAVIGLGQGLELPVVAEGVETREQLAFLAKASCSGVQGYLIGCPKAIADYAATVGRPVKPQLYAVAG